MRPERYRMLVTCEHGGNRVPPPLAPHFAGEGEALRGHRGWDPGALELATELAQAFAAPLLHGEVSRLVVDLNRARRSRRLFSEYTRHLGRDEREALLREHYGPYRERAAAAVAHLQKGGDAVLHLSVHSFTPSLNGQERLADVGLLYDPSRRRERDLCLRWQEALLREDGTLRVRRNYPYRGKADGLTTSLRRVFAAETYLGIEVEVNQRHALAGGAPWHRLRAAICEGLARAVAPRRGRPPSQTAGTSRREDA